MEQIKKRTIFLGVAGFALLVAAVKFLAPTRVNESLSPMTTESDRTSQTMPSAVVEGTPQSSTDLMANALQPKDVSATVTYQNPGGEDQVGFTLSVDAAGVIVDAKTVVLATNDISKKRQLAFAEKLPMAVKGKKLSELSAVDRVGGSSLTTQAFNDSINQLQSQM